jgi:hypothetical protein
LGSLFTFIFAVLGTKPQASLTHARQAHPIDMHPSPWLVVLYPCDTTWIEVYKTSSFVKGTPSSSKEQISQDS